MIQLVVFDIAGTTVYDGDAVNRCFRKALAAAGLQVPPAQVNQVMGLAKPEAVRLLLEASGEADPARVAEIHGDFVRRMQEYYRTSPEVQEIPGAAAAFRELRSRGLVVALDTGFSREIVEPILDRLGWRIPEVLDDWIASDEVPHGRPYPDMIRSLMARWDINDPAHVAKVGDTRADLEEGANTGCGLVIGVCSGAASREELEAIPHTHLLNSVAEVPAVIEAHAPALLVR